MGAICYMQGRLEETIELLNNALELNPNYPEAHNNLGNTLKELGDLDAAITAYNKALKLNPNLSQAHTNLGLVLQEQGNLDAAVAAYNKALKLNPDLPQAHNNLGIALQKQGELDASIAAYNKALELDPNYPEAHNNLGIVLREQNDLDAAITSYNKALELKRNYPEAHYNLGLALQEKGDVDAAIASYNSALELEPNHPAAQNNLGAAFHEQGELTAAINAYDAALQVNPNYAEAHYNTSLIMLLCGDYKNGWEKYEWRTKRRKNPTKPHANPKCRPWNETSPDPERKILLVSEQGLGDTIQFMRYAPALRNQGYSVSICAQAKLHSLIKASRVDTSPLTPHQADEVNEGQWIPLLSVPRLLEVSPDNPIVNDLYINIVDEHYVKWENILSAERRPIIGINWQGNPNTELRELRGRSLPLEAFASISINCQIAFLSLQKGYGSEQLKTCSFKDRFVSCQKLVDETWDFLETAAIIANCDLVITSDTSVAHLAGGMGKTTWLLLQKIPDWRWGLEGDTTFWYPSMRLFRQRERGNWDEPIRRVVQALQEEFIPLSEPKR
jgi:tetratricopeptide (TPR) repeat protein